MYLGDISGVCRLWSQQTPMLIGRVHFDFGLNVSINAKACEEREIKHVLIYLFPAVLSAAQ